MTGLDSIAGAEVVIMRMFWTHRSVQSLNGSSSSSGHTIRYAGQAAQWLIRREIVQLWPHGG